MLAALGALATIPVQATEPLQCGIVLLHGKWGDPKLLNGVARQLSGVCEVLQPEMAWSRRRMYDKPYAAALQEITPLLAQLRAKGYARVLLGGQSLGANAALAYAAQVGGVQGVLAMSPGHIPERWYRAADKTRPAVDKARALVEAGQGEQTLEITDINSGRTQALSLRADVLLSYFDPQGWGNMPRSVDLLAHADKPVPLLWVIGAQDPLYEGPNGYDFYKAPMHPSSRYVVVDAGHMNAPDVAAAAVLDWVKALP
ncbi:alpha/beta hydrolase [Curvibacter sp. CHRR-16]|nr:alpha/beta hydrolase [Curvibacter sp. CHRR-16]